MSYGLKERIRNAALSDATLLALFGTVSPASLRWYDTQLLPGSAFPAMVVQVISDPEMTANAGPLPTSFARVQFTAWADQTSAGAEALQAIHYAMVQFFATLNLTSAGGLHGPNRIVGKRDGFYAQTQPAKLLLLIDAMIFWDHTISS